MQTASVIFKGSDGVTAGATLAESVEGGSNYVASSTVTAAKNLSYGPKMVNAKLPDAAGWTGSIDFGVVLNPNSEVSAKKINILLVGAEVFPATRHSNIVWVYGTWNDLPNQIDTGLL